MGGELPELIGHDFAQELINYTDKIYLEFGADEHIEGLGNEDKVKEIRKKRLKRGSNSWIAPSVIWAPKRRRAYISP